MTWSTAVLVLATLGAALMAGTFFVFSVAVMPALRRLPASRAVAAMQSINATILNPVFLGAFVGTAVLAAVLVVAGLIGGEQRGMAWMIAGGLLYLLGVFGLTIIVHVPRNERLARADAESPSTEALWAAYLGVWLPWNHVRALASAGATLAWSVAALDR
ncbi:MAG TPA: anthrone oxygenase family protein [Myxococcaceae bacterium]|nr:anthrone oxygenase family protein [Myxococcaceae bacterium]